MALALVALSLVALLGAHAAPRAGPATDAGTALRLTALPRETGVTIATLPAVPGFPVTLDGVTRPTDPAGNAHFDRPRGTRPLAGRITLTEAVVRIGGQEVRASANRLYPSPSGPVLALDLAYLVRFGFSSASGAPIDASSLTTVTVKSPAGEVAALPADGASWLYGSRVVSDGTALTVDHLEWSVQEVRYAGSNVVNASQQRFRPAEQQTVGVQLLFFSMDLQVHDAMFGYRHGGAVELVYPDGRARRLDLDAAGRLHVAALPRGDYTLTILGSGPRMQRPLAISRDQDLDLAFYSWWDVGTVLAALAGLALALAAAGQIRRRRPTVRGKHRRDDAPTATVVDLQEIQARRSEELPAEHAVLRGRRTR